MSRPTVHDIARTAGVSLATVDRVLNERPGVREKTIARVTSAIEKIGYVRDVAAANLARRRDYNLVFVLPEAATAPTRKLLEAVNEVKSGSAADRINLSVLSVPANDPHALAKTLRGIEAKPVDGVAIMAPETPQIRDAIRRLKERGFSVVAIVSDLPNSDRDQFVGINNIAAGRTAGVLLGRFLGQAPAKVMVIAGSMQARDHVERRLGFDQIMASRFAHLDVLPSIEGWNDAGTIETLVRQALAADQGIRGIYSIGAGNQGLIRALDETGRGTEIAVVAHELVSHSRAALESGTFDAVIAQDFGHVVRSAIRMLRANSYNLDVIPSQERIRIEIFLNENLP